MAQFPTIEWEDRLRSQGYSCIAGIDEVGRGAWAGPLVASACVLKEDFASTDLRDSKQLTAGQREVLFEEITKHAAGFGIGVVEPFEIDLFGMTQATQLAFRRALNEIRLQCDYALVDAFVLEGARIPNEGIIRGDEKVTSIAAASVLAKVTRDRMMQEMAKKFPGYGFETNVGYGTKEHMEAIKKLGLLSVHRKLFVRNLMAEIAG